MGVKLTVGLLRDAWRDYPSDRAAMASFPAGPPIFLGGTHRSGTTWMAEMLAEDGIWYIHEPFNPNKRLWTEPFTYARPDTERCDVDRFVGKLLSGGFRQASNNRHTRHSLMPLRLFRPPFRRMMIKDPLACLLSGYLARRFPMQVRILFRHPAGFVSSISRLGWPSGEYLRQFLDRDQLMQDHLEPFRKLMEEYAYRKDVESATVLHGVLNLVEWNTIRANPAIRYHLFEDLCMDPLGAFEKIFSELDLPYAAATRHRHEKLCFTGSAEPGDYRTHAVARNSRAMADSWKKLLNPDQVARIRRIWERFDIPLYRRDEEWLV